MVKTLPSNAGGTRLIPGRGAGIPHVSQPKNQNINRSNIVTNSIKMLKIIHIKKNLKKNKMAIRTYILIITLNVNRSNVLTKRYRLPEWIRKKITHVYAV